MQDAAGLARAVSPNPGSDYRRGALLVAAAAFAWSSAGLIARTTTVGAGTTLFWRSLFAFLFTLGFVAFAERGRTLEQFRRLGLAGVAIAASFAGSMIAFIVALPDTTIANIMVFQAASPFVAAVIAWAWMRERIAFRSVCAIFATMLGIVVMVSNSVAEGHLRGDILAALLALSFSLTIVLVRRYRSVPMTAATCTAVFISSIVALPFASFSIGPTDLALMAAFGCGQMGLGLVLFTAGVRLIPVADAGLITTLEVVLGPLWVWAAFGEDPGMRTLIGATIVLIAVVTHTLLERRARMALR